ncbi:MAG: hypothetical protein HUK07_02825, partial [Bacteroidaceae bacterium]|nr:hypothetical protein [Bacteroidaceae bacterium]
PVDFTDFVDNMSFETGSLGKWTAPTSDDTGVKPNSNATYTTNGIDGDYLFNTWGGKAELKVSQKVENVPNGIYKLTALYASDANNVGMLFANNDTLNITASPEGKGQFVEATLIAAVVDNTLNIGMTSKDWFKTDHFRLTYCGNDAEGAKEYFHASVPQFDPEAQISESVLEAYNNAVEAANAGVNNAEDAVAAIAEIKVAAVAVDENMAAWTEYQNKLQVAYATLQDESLDNTATAVGILSDYYDNSLDIINDKQLTTEELKAELAKLDEMINAAMQCLKSGADFTRYLKNPEMDAAAGWNGNPTINEKCGEKYASGEFDVYQVVEADVPVGLYEISMQGFYREYRDDNADKVAWYNVFEATEDAHTYKAGCPKPIAWVYMNTNKTALNCVYDYTREGVYDADSKEFTCDFYGSGFSVDPYNKYAYPNNMATAAKAFADGAYKKEAYGLVAKAGDKLRIGVKGNLGGSDWAIFDNFKLTYRAKDAAIINKLLPDAKASLDLTDKQVGKDVKEAVNAAITAAESASSVDEKFDALAKCFELGETIDASVAKFKALDIALGELEAAINEAEYIGVAENTKTSAGTLLKNAFEGLNGGYTDADADAALVQIEEMIKQLQLPEFIGSDDNPVSFTGFIKNADLEGLTVKNDKFGAWTWKKSGGNGPMFPYGAASSTAAEFWAGSAADLQFSLTQEVTGLPAGKYALYAYAGNGYDNQASLGNAGRAYLFVETPGKTEIPSVAVEPSTDPASAGNQQYKVIFTVEEGDVVTLGFKSAGTMDARWFWCDTFSLECYGTNSKQTDTPDAISGALAIKDVEQNETVATPVAIFNAAGVKTPTLSKGLNIIRMSDGKTRKVMVK